MKREVVLFLVLLLLVVTVTDETQMPESSVMIVGSEFVLSDVEIPIYEFIPPDVNLTYAEDMAFSLFGFRDSAAVDTEDSFIVRSGNKSFEVNKRDGSIWYADYDKLWNIAEGILDHNPTMCKDIADTWLDEKGILPSNYVFANFGSTNATAWNIDAEDFQTKVLHWQVNYEMFIGDVSVSGPGEQISVIIGGFGEIVGLSWNHRNIENEPHSTAPLIEYESILDNYEISPDDVVEHKLTYYADSEDESNLLEPYYEIVLDAADDEEDIYQIFLVPAALLPPKVQIVSPDWASSHEQGDAVTFECVMLQGLAPFTFYWYSDFDGLISGSQNFTISSLSAAVKKGVTVPHTIHVRVKDSADRWCMHYRAVFIEPGELSTFPQTLTIVAAAGGFVVVLGVAVLLLKRRRAVGVLLFLLMLMSAFMVFPIISASGEAHNSRTFQPCAPEGAYDDGVKEVGIEWCGISVNKPLWNTETNIEGFYNWMGNIGGYNREFNWGEFSAWEQDFKDEAFGGTDSEWVDAVDFVYYQDHGGPDGVTFRSSHDDRTLHFRECRLGDGDLETIVFDACSPLKWENSTGHNVFERWAETLQGIHMVCGFGSTSHNVKTRGAKFGLYMTGYGSAIQPRTIKDAWFRACAETEGSSIISAVFYASKSTDPLNPQQDDPVNDHAYGYGYVCSDPVPGTFGWYVLITSNC